MARMARLRIDGLADGEEGWYHVYARASGPIDAYPLSKPLVYRKLLSIIEFYTKAYFCSVAAVTIMGSHYHAVLAFEAEREVSVEELQERAERMYPGEASKREIELWSPEQWTRFGKRLFDLSELMRNIQMAFTRWLNSTTSRRGRFWAERFGSVILEDRRAVLDCMLYIELNPVRAGLYDRPEECPTSSLYLREIGQADWLMPLTRVCAQDTEAAALTEYRERIYYRGAVPTKEAGRPINPEILAEEIKRGFAVSGVYKRRLAYFARGLVIGSEEFILQHLETLRSTGRYLRRSRAIRQLGGAHFSLREQRGLANTT